MSWYQYEWLLERAYMLIPSQVKEKKRFEVPKARIVVEKNRTRILNFGQIADVINRDPKLIMKYLTKELATSGTLEGGTLILKGLFTPAKVNEKIKEFVREYVICPECGSPDTVLVREGRVLILKCLACGAKRPVKPIK